MAALARLFAPALLLTCGIAGCANSGAISNRAHSAAAAQTGPQCPFRDAPFAEEEDEFLGNQFDPVDLPEDRAARRQARWAKRHGWDAVEWLPGSTSLQWATRGDCRWLLDALGRPLQVGEPELLLTDTQPLYRNDADGDLLLLEFGWDAEYSQRVVPAPVGRLLRHDRSGTRLSPLLQMSPKLDPDGWPHPLYPRERYGDYPTPAFGLRGNGDTPAWIVRPPGGGFGVLDTHSMDYLLPPRFSEIRGHGLPLDQGARVRFWAALDAAPGTTGVVADAPIQLFDPAGQPLLAELRIGAIEPAARGNLLPLRLHDPALPPPAPVPVPRRFDDDAAAAADDAADGIALGWVQRETLDSHRARASAGNACAYLMADGALADVRGYSDGSARCPEPERGLLLLDDGRGHGTVLQVSETDADAAPRRLGISDLRARIVALQAPPDAPAGMPGLVVTANGNDSGTRFRLYDLDGRALSPIRFDAFVDAGCGHWHLHDGDSDTWYGVRNDGSLSLTRTVPFSC